jgi:hypothetical protein
MIVARRFYRRVPEPALRPGGRPEHRRVTAQGPSLILRAELSELRARLKLVKNYCA